MRAFIATHDGNERTLWLSRGDTHRCTYGVPFRPTAGDVRDAYVARPGHGDLRPPPAHERPAPAPDVIARTAWQRRPGAAGASVRSPARARGSALVAHAPHRPGRIRQLALQRALVVR